MGPEPKPGQATPEIARALPPDGGPFPGVDISGGAESGAGDGRSLLALLSESAVWARLTAAASTPGYYSWHAVERDPSSDTGWVAIDDGLSGTGNAYERNGNRHVPADSSFGPVVLLMRSTVSESDDEWLFDYEGSGTGPVVRVTSTTPDADGYYPAVLETYAPGSAYPHLADSATAVKAVETSSTTPSTSVRYPAAFLGVDPASGQDTYALLAPGAGGSSSLAVAGVNPGAGDSTISVSGVSELQFDESDCFTVVDVGGGVAKVAARAASATHDGILTTGTQTLAGIKNWTGAAGFSGGVTVSSTADFIGSVNFSFGFQLVSATLGNTLVRGTAELFPPGGTLVCGFSTSMPGLAVGGHATQVGVEWGGAGRLTLRWADSITGLYSLQPKITIHDSAGTWYDGATAGGPGGLSFVGGVCVSGGVSGVTGTVP